MAATDLDDGTFTAALADAPMAIVDFHAGWCGPCIMFKPKFKRISGDYPHVSFFMVDGEKAPEARKTVQIDNLPFFAVYRDGQLLEGLSTANEEAFRAFVEKHFGTAP
ncbi:MAG: thioredoxin family protein [Alphaproteobacteria bacterium]|nr:thioredoxin family protein [Alphaproteobacteria bacterium]MCB9694847.1 thioredoxin family protein [Alphaproteobacteria bacterium]